MVISMIMNIYDAEPKNLGSCSGRLLGLYLVSCRGALPAKQDASHVNNRLPQAKCQIMTANGAGILLHSVRCWKWMLCPSPATNLDRCSDSTVSSREQLVGLCNTIMWRPHEYFDHTGSSQPPRRIVVLSWFPTQ